MKRCVICQKPHCVCGCDLYEDDQPAFPAPPRWGLVLFFWLIGVACGIVLFAAVHPR